MRNTIVFCSWTSEIVLEWLHEGCDNDLSVDFPHFGASEFPSQNPFKKCFKIVFFSLWRRDAVLELRFPTPLRVFLFVFCNSVSADHIVVAASRLLGAAAACAILVSFAPGLRKSYWSGCMKAAKWICWQIFSILAPAIFFLKILLKNPSKSSFFALASRSGFGAAISDPVARISIVFCNSNFADRIVVAASKLLPALAACIILLSFAAALRKSIGVAA